jgi:hypothetical protein
MMSGTEVNELMLYNCAECRNWIWCDPIYIWHCPNCNATGLDVVRHPVVPIVFDHYWRAAGNVVQWRPA